MQFTATELALLQQAAADAGPAREAHALSLIKRGGMNIPQIAATTGMARNDVYNLKRRHKMFDPAHAARLESYRKRREEWAAAYRAGVPILDIARKSGVEYQTVYNVLYNHKILRKKVVALPTGPRRERDAEIFRLRAAGMQPMQIAEHMNMKIDTLRAVLRRAKLREKKEAK